MGDRGTVTSIAQGDENPHFVQPKPSFVALLRDADLFVTTGLDLELWVPTLLDRAGNRKIMEGGPGYVAAYTGITLLEVPVSLSRAGGDIHADGNPHIHTDPRQRHHHRAEHPVRAGPGGRRPMRSTTGRGSSTSSSGSSRPPSGRNWSASSRRPTAFNLLKTGQFDGFIQKTVLHGKPLADQLGGWLHQGRAFRGKEMTCYHKEWSYFSARFQVTCVAYVEAKPGIPPTPGHVEEVIALMKERQIPVLFATNYYPRSQIEQVAAKTGAAAVIVPENTFGAPGVTTYIDLVNTWVTGLAAGFGKKH